MSGPKFTAGEWYPGEWSCHADTAVLTQIDGKTVAVAECSGLGRYASESIDDVRLFAAAKDLLQVAQDFDDALRELDLHCECGEKDCRTSRLRAVLAKVKGGAA